MPSQTYVDLYFSWQIPSNSVPLPGDFTLDFGIINVFDKAPPRETVFQSFSGLDAQPYSLYGDPRRRRFELALTSRF